MEMYRWKKKRSDKSIIVKRIGQIVHITIKKKTTSNFVQNAP